MARQGHGPEALAGQPTRPQSSLAHLPVHPSRHAPLLASAHPPVRRPSQPATQPWWCCGCRAAAAQLLCVPAWQLGAPFRRLCCRCSARCSASPACCAPLHECINNDEDSPEHLIPTPNFTPLFPSQLPPPPVCVAQLSSCALPAPPTRHPFLAPSALPAAARTRSLSQPHCRARSSPLLFTSGSAPAAMWSSQAAQVCASLPPSKGFVCLAARLASCPAGLETAADVPGTPAGGCLSLPRTLSALASVCVPPHPTAVSPLACSLHTFGAARPRAARGGYAPAAACAVRAALAP